MNEIELTPPDLEQCQAEKPNGLNFMTLGGQSRLERCTNKPTVVAYETYAGSDGQYGSMSLCSERLGVFMKERGHKDGYHFEEIKK
jgi:hypothetical protein